MQWFEVLGRGFEDSYERRFTAPGTVGASIFLYYLSLQQTCNKSLALTYFLLVYYGPGVTAAMNAHIQLFPSGLLLIEDFHTELLHTEKLHSELVHTETSHRAATQRETSSQFVYNS